MSGDPARRRIAVAGHVASDVELLLRDVLALGSLVVPVLSEAHWTTGTLSRAHGLAGFSLIRGGCRVGWGSVRPRFGGSLRPCGAGRPVAGQGGQGVCGGVRSAAHQRVVITGRERGAPPQLI